MTLTRLALPGALLAVSFAARAAPVKVPLSAGVRTNPQTSVVGGDLVTNEEINEALADDGEGEDAGPIQMEGNFARANVNRAITAFSEAAARDARDSRRARANSQVVQSFTGVNFFDQRFSNNGNQFSVEPPDQALCVGAGFVVESVNDVMRIFDTAGGLVVGPVDLNSFYGYPPAIDRTKSPLQFGPSITDPICLFDQETQRFFHVVLTLDRAAPTTQNLSGRNHLDIAVSDTSNPAGTWTVFTLPVQNDGSEGTPNHRCTGGPCLGDYPHIGADANAIFLTTNEFNLAAPGFRGAQIYAISKRALVSHSANVSAILFNTGNPDDSPVVGHTVWAAQSPAKGEFENEGQGTEFLLSADAVFSNTFTSSDLVVWTVSNTRSLDTGRGTPVLDVKTVAVDQYGGPVPKADQKAGNLPLRDCIADLGTPTRTRCGLIVGSGAVRNFGAARLDTNDTRMQQVTFAKGLLWGALDTAVSVGGATKAGIAFFVLNPKNGRIATQGTIAVANNNVSYPAIGVSRQGRGVLAFTLVGADHFPSAAFVTLDARAGAGPVHVVAEGAGPQDGFTGYPSFSNRPRWGDYGAAATDGDSVWISSEFVAQTCDFTTYLQAPFGTCGNTRGSLGNWATRVSQVRPGEIDDD